MFALLRLISALVFDRFKSRRRLEIENLYLRHQLNIAMRKAPLRLRLRGTDRAFMVWMTRLWPGLLSLSRVVRPDTIMRWQEQGFEPTGVGSLAVGRDAPGSVANCASSFGG